MDSIVKKRDPFSNKGDYGRVYIVGGSNGMCGSAYLASMAALRCGSGLVYTIVSEIIPEIMQIKSAENIVPPFECEDKKLSDNSISQILEYISNKNYVAIGCGIGKNKLGYELTKSVLKNFHKPVLIDVDGLNSIKSFSELEFEDYSVTTTPRPLEFSRLSGLDAEYINQNREKVATDFSEKHRCVVILRGHHAIVAKDDEIYVNNAGDAGMVAAGSGGCLFGIIASFMHNRDMFEACRLGVYTYGLIRDFAKQKVGGDGITASDVIKDLPGVINARKEE